jgi:hypothetical protein
MTTRGILALAMSCVIMVGLALGSTKDEDLQAIQDAIRQQGANWIAESNPIWELSNEEQRILCGLILEDLKDPFRIRYESTQVDAVDEVLDWRDYEGNDFVTGIRDQGQCGSCWAFGALAAMESRTLIMANTPGYELDLSEQYLVSCSPGSCNGYSLSGTCIFLENDGTVDEDCFIYRANDQIPCASACSDWSERIRVIDDWYWLNSNEQAIKNELQNGPVYAGFRVYEDFYSYSSGVYQHVWGSQLGAHAISIIGWDDGTDCWICKNSWGPGWGEDGYFRIRKGQNECGIEEWTCTLYPTETEYPFLELTGTTVVEDVGDGDGVLNPGETAQLILNVSNAPLCQQAANVQGELSTDDPRVTILDDLGTFGSIHGGESGENSADPFVIQVYEGVELTPIEFTVHLSTTGGYTADRELSVEVTLYQVGFPYQIALGVESSPLAFDIDRDGSKEVLSGAGNGNFYVWEEGGEIAQGFPYHIGHRIVGAPAVGDVDGDDSPDIVFGCWDYYLYALDAAGNEVFDPVDLGCFVMATPALADLDSQPGLEIVAASLDGKIWVVKGDGGVLTGFPVQLPGSAVAINGAALADIAGDTLPEIIVATYHGTLYALNAFGSVLWETPLDGYVRSDLTVANLTGEGLRILVCTMAGDLVIVDTDGFEINRFNLGSSIRTSPVPADLDYDSDLEIVLSTMGGELYVLNPDGTNCDHFPISFGHTTVSSAAISDLDDDGSPEIVFGDNYNQLHAFNLMGQELPYFPLDMTGSVFSSPAITDLDGDGDQEIIVGTGGSLGIVDYKTASWRNNYWNMFRGNPQRTANYHDGFSFGVEEPGVAAGKPVPLRYSLAPNYPNPFNPSTVLTYSINQPLLVSLTIWNVLGEKVATLVNGSTNAGSHRVHFNASNLGSGVYFARLQVGSGVQVRKLVLIR